MNSINNDFRLNTKKIRDAISDNRPDIALLVLKNVLDELNDDILSSQLAITKSRLNKLLKKYKRNNNIDFNEEQELEYNRISMSILELSDNVRTFLSREYSKDIILKNSKSIKDVDDKLEQMKREALLAKENIKKSVELNFYVKQEQINKLGECWSEIYLIEKKFFDILKEVLSTSTNNSNENKIDTIEKMLPNRIRLSVKEHEYFCKLFEDLFLEFKKSDFVLEKSRYWLGGKLYKAARDYHDCFPRFFASFKAKDYEECDICYDRMKVNKTDVAKIIEKIQEQIGL